MPGVTTADLIAGEADGWLVGSPLLSEHHVDHEPPLASYARS
jgi:hypothetical protein